MFSSRYSTELVLSDGTRLNIRPIQPEDEPLMVRFHATLSEQSVYTRYFNMLPMENRVAHERLTRLCFIDYNREMALVAEVVEVPNQPGSATGIAGVGRLIRSPQGGNAEVAAIVSDRFQHRGIGRELVRGLIQFAKDQQVKTLTAAVLAVNPAMQKLLESLGFVFTDSGDYEVLEGELRL